MKNIVVIDLNVFVRALLTSGADKVIYTTIKAGKITPAFCPDMFKNLADVLIRPHLKLGIRDVKEVLTIIKDNALVIKPEIKITACRDASDNIILETAAACNAKAIVTNDADLLILNPFRNIPIVNSRKFLELLKDM